MWTALDHDLTVRQIRSIVSDINNGISVERVLTDAGVELGRIEFSLPPDTYCELRRRADLANKEPEDVVTAALSDYFSER